MDRHLKARGTSAATLFLLSLGCLCGPPPWHAARGEEVDQHPATPPSSAAQALSPSVRVLGISATPLDDARWWDVAGEPLASAPQSTAVKPNLGEGLEHERGESLRLIAMEARVAPSAVVAVHAENQKLTLRLPESVDGVSWDELKTRAEQEDAPDVPHEAREIVYSLATVVILKPRQRDISLRVSVADGPWKTVASRPREPKEGNDIKFSLGAMTREGIQSFLPEVDGHDVRVMAEDQKGELHRSAFHMQMKGNDRTVLSYRARFQLPAAEIVAFHLQARPLRWFDLGSVPAYPASIPAADEIRLAGGTFAGDRDPAPEEPNSPTSRVPASDEPSALDWCGVHDGQLQRIGELESLRRAYLASEWLTDEGLKHLRDCPRLETVRVISPQVSSAGLAVLAGSTVRRLEMQGERMRSIETSDLEQFAESQQLEALLLWDTQLTDENLRAIGGMESLRVLVADGRNVSDAGLQHLARLTHLERLDLGVTRCTDEGLRHVAGIEPLQWINVRSPQVSDEGARHLARASQLRRIDLRGCQISDVGVRHLSPLSHLEWLDLRETHATRAGWRVLYDANNDLQCRLPDPPPRNIALRVRVTTADGSLPAPGVDVHLFTSSYAYALGGDAWGPGPEPKRLATATTGADGSCQLSFGEEQSEGELVLWAIPTDSSMQSGGPQASVFRLRLDEGPTGTVVERSLQLRGGETTLQVVDADRRPLSGIEVLPLRIRSSGGVGEHNIPPSLLQAGIVQVTGPDGRVTLHGFAPDQLTNIGFRDSASSDSGIGNQATGWRRDFPTDSEITVRLQSTGSLQGRLASDRPVDPSKLRGIVYTERIGRREEGIVDVRHSWATLEIEADGDFVLPHIAPGSLLWVERSDEDQPLRLQLGPQRAAAGRATPLDLTAVELVPVRGVVRLLPDWEAPADLEIRVRHGHRHQDWSNYETITTDRSGRFEASVLPGDYVLDINAFYEGAYRSIENWKWRDGRLGGNYHTHEAPENNHSRTAEVEPLEMAKTSDAVGRVVDAEGEPIAGATVNGWPTHGDDDAANCVGAHTRSDGTFEMHHPVTHPPVRFENGNDQPYQILERDPLILTPTPKKGSGAFLGD